MQHLPGYSFLLLSALIILSNYYWLLRSIFKKESTSFTLFLGAFFGLIGILSSPVPNSLFWLPLVVDFTPGLILWRVLKSKSDQ